MIELFKAMATIWLSVFVLYVCTTFILGITIVVLTGINYALNSVRKYFKELYGLC